MLTHYITPENIDSLEKMFAEPHFNEDVGIYWVIPNWLIDLKNTPMGESQPIPD